MIPRGDCHLESEAALTSILSRGFPGPVQPGGTWFAVAKENLFPKQAAKLCLSEVTI